MGPAEESAAVAAASPPGAVRPVTTVAAMAHASLVRRRDRARADRNRFIAWAMVAAGMALGAAANGDMGLAAFFIALGAFETVGARLCARRTETWADAVAHFFDGPGGPAQQAQGG